MTAIIIEDSDKSRLLLETLIKDYCPNITSILQAKNLMDGIELIRFNTVDIVFLDIEMPQHSGLQIIDFIDSKEMNFEIIFTTAYSEYALQAFEISAVDYLLKPLRPKKLIQAVSKAMEQIENKNMPNRLEELKKVLKSEQFKKIPVPTSNGIRFIDYESILYVEADSMYARFHLKTTENPLFVSRPLRFFEEKLLLNGMFYKPHRSYIINLKHITSFIKKGGAHIIIDEKHHIPVSKDHKKEILQVIENLS